MDSNCSRETEYIELLLCYRIIKLNVLLAIYEYKYLTELEKAPTRSHVEKLFQGVLILASMSLNLP